MNRRRGGIDSGIVLLGLIAFVVVVAIVFLVLQLRTDVVAESVREGRPIVAAFLVSRDDALLCTELLLFQPTTGKVALFDIPGEWGDILAELGRMDRIDLLYERGSPGKFIAKVATLLDVSIPWYVEMSVDEVEELVDLLDGLELFIANPVDLPDADPPALLPSGSLVLDGAKVREFLLYNDPDEADIDRRARYQKFVEALLKRIGRRSQYVLHPEVLREVGRIVSTNLGSRAFKSFIGELANVDADHIVPKQVHGDRVAVDDQVLLFPHFEGNLIRESIRQTLVSLANVEVVGEDELTVVLQILNGTGRNGLASRTAQLISDFGYDVLPAANADRSDYENTIVISNTGDISKAQQVAKLIRCSRVEVREAENAPDASAALNERADVTIILGLDFDGRYCQE